MEEEAGVRAPVTRRRGRISVEVSDEGKPSSAPGTPTKKRGGRKPAKTELELINENVAEENVKTTTKKTAVKELKEIEEKPVTPSRRSARIKSNTSIVSDTVQTFDSPRAKRAARRTSQAGSDNEIPLTPIRQTRRTRRDSTSSIEKQDAVTSDVKASTKIPEPISEEPENTTKVTNGELRTSDNENSKQSPVRRSPRLRNKKSLSNTPEKDDENNGLGDNTTNASQSKNEESEDKVSSTVSPERTNESKNSPNNAIKESSEKEKLSTSSANLIRDLDMNPRKKINVNKSMIEAQESNKVKPKRQRTKSWTTITTPVVTKDDFYSDNEKTRKKRQSKCYVVLDDINNSGSGDCKRNNSNTEGIDVTEKNSSMNKSSVNKETSLHTSNKLDSNNDAGVDSGITNLFKNDPSNNIQTVVLIEDSDSNSKHSKTHKEDANEDQCVPVVDHELEDEKSNDEPDHALATPFEANNESIFKHTTSFEFKQSNANDSCEPMDVDETLPEILTNNLSNKEIESKDKSISHETATNESLNKSKRKSSKRVSTCENLDKSGNENKSTLILSQLKDSISENKSPQILSKSLNTPNVTVATTEINKTLSKTYLTSTPLQKKNMEKQNEQISNIFDNNDSKSKNKTTPKKNMSAITNSQSSDDNSTADEESEASDKESLLDNEAEEASDSYLSGDSRDEEEKQYEKENEVVEKGETLTSDEEFSNDSDYEKDSFLVSSNEEDNELLSGTSDDLSMSDNELKMTSKSKKKYNERKLKQQKQASREMFQSRHKLTDSKNRSKLKIQSSQSSDSSESEDDVIGSRKNKRNRLVSFNESGAKSDLENTVQMENQQERRKSLESNALIEKEITICEETSKEINDPLATQIKLEPKTPIKDTNMSVGFVDANNVKNTPCQQNSSKSKNPLEDSDDDSSSLSSGDIKITNNYDKVLKELKSKNANVSLNADEKSKANSKQNKSGVDLNSTQLKESTKVKNKSSQNINDVSLNLNTSEKESENINKTINPDDIAHTGTVKKSNVGNLSLNSNKKSKKKDKKSIVDQLNLTQVKDKSAKTAVKTKSKPAKEKKESCMDDSSDSIDLKLLFSEDSVNSIDSNKHKERKTDDKLEEFIPLKKSEAKTNIRANEDTDNQEEEMPFFIDTVGDSSMREENDKGQESDSLSTADSNDGGPPLEISYKKRNSLSNNVKEKDNLINISQSEKPSNTLNASNIIGSEKKKNKRKSLNKSNVTETQTTESGEVVNQTLVSKTPKSESKKKNTSLLESHNESILEPVKDTEDATNQSVVPKTPKSDKKKKKNNSVSEAQNEIILPESKLTETENINQSLTKTPKSEKKKNKKLSETQVTDTDNAVNKSITSKTPKSEKNKSILSESLHMSILTKLDDSDEEKNKSVNIKTPKSAKKKMNLSEPLNKSNVDVPETIDATEVINKSLNSQTAKEKKKKNLSQSLNISILPSIEISDTEENTPTEIINTSGGKKKKHSKSLNSSMLEENKTLDQSNKSPKKKQNIGTADEDQKTETEIKAKDNIADEGEKDNEGAKKRKRKHSGTPAIEDFITGEATNESVRRQSKKLRVSQNSEDTVNDKTETADIKAFGSSQKSQNNTISPKKKNKKSTEAERNQSQNKNEKNLLSEIHFAGQNENKENGHEHIHDVGRDSQASVSGNTKTKISKSKKRKHREDDDGRHKNAKVLKENSLDQIHIPRLPPSVLNKLADKPKMKAPVKKQKAISTTEFQVETAKTRRNKPSNYLEESIYIKDGEDNGASKKPKRVIKKPQVLPFVPTASISNSGFTTNFKVNVIPQDIKFVAQSTNVSNFKNDYLYRNKNKLVAQTSFKKYRNIKMSKF
ncbi:PREDICTED: MATH and LRR domain-containing protein PFE0570w-like [Papilio xuthus]|uniref:MATH and LRR domain-containing protein PFE0570w-like n=1 Tax=Papilio xuthus TaxID=66420 RepID=A0AAJ6ZRV5_PAPXU|nr:PREDICTED: MATH and LRR domain-containing protein PFE0570w-like [Papilio xuthus]